MNEINVVVCESVALKVNPFHEYGNIPEQMVIAVVLVTIGFTVRFKVANESQPAMETNDAVCDPDPLNVIPFHT